MITTIVLVLAAVVVALLAYAATKPDTMQVQRSATIDAPADRIFPLIADFHNWGAWSPYDKLDPAMKARTAGRQAAKARSSPSRVTTSRNSSWRLKATERR
jgi:hypothetical protein